MHAWDTFPSCLASSRIPIFVLMIFCRFAALCSLSQKCIGFFDKCQILSWLSQRRITRISCDIDGFCKALEAYLRSRLLLPTDTVKARFPGSRMALSEVITTTLLFQPSGCRCFKLFYKWVVQGTQLERYFPQTVRCNRFVELTRHGLMPLALYVRGFRPGSGASSMAFIDSTPLKVCHNRPIYSLGPRRARENLD